MCKIRKTRYNILEQRCRNGRRGNTRSDTGIFIMGCRSVRGRLSMWLQLVHYRHERMRVIVRTDRI